MAAPKLVHNFSEVKPKLTLRIVAKSGYLLTDFKKRDSWSNSVSFTSPVKGMIGTPKSKFSKKLLDKLSTKTVFLMSSPSIALLPHR